MKQFHPGAPIGVRSKDCYKGSLVTSLSSVWRRFGQSDHRQGFLRPPQTRSHLAVTTHRLRVLSTECFEWLAERTAIAVHCEPVGVCKAYAMCFLRDALNI